MLRQAHIYLPNEGGLPAILVPVFNTGGWIVEQPKPKVLAGWRQSIALAMGVRSVLQQFALKEVDIRGGGSARKNPTFRVSRCRTLRDFDSTYLRIIICAQNEAELFFDAYAVPHYETEIELRTTLNPCGLDVEMGRKLLRLFDACEKWSEHMT